MREQSHQSRSGAENERRHVIKKLNRGGKRRRLLAARLYMCSEELPCEQSECPECRQLKATGETVPPRKAASRPATLETQAIPIETIEPVFHQRPLLDANLELIVESIGASGMRHPISVVALADNRYGLLDGAYRLAAQRRLGAIDIECSVETDEYAAKLWNLAANLCRVDLTALDRALSLSAYLDLVRERLKDGQVAQPGGRQPRDKGFSRAAGELGWPREKIRRAAQIAALSPEARAMARELKLEDNERRLLRAAKQPNSTAQISSLREAAKSRVTRDRQKDSVNAGVEGKISVSPQPTIEKRGGVDPTTAPLVPAFLAPEHGDDDGLELPLALLRLSDGEREIADQLITLWRQATPRIRRFVQQHLNLIDEERTVAVVNQSPETNQ